jgi:hypothetical protein
VIALLIVGSIFTALGLAVCTDAVLRHVRRDDLAFWLMSWALKWQELALGISLLGLGVIILAAVLTS